MRDLLINALINKPVNVYESSVVQKIVLHHITRQRVDYIHVLSYVVRQKRFFALGVCCRHAMVFETIGSWCDSMVHKRFVNKGIAAAFE